MAKRPAIASDDPDHVHRMLQRYRLYEMLHAKQVDCLQRSADLSYKEARAYLIDVYETPQVMADSLGVTLQAVYNMRRRAKKKVEECGMTEEEIFGEFVPVDLRIQ